MVAMAYTNNPSDYSVAVLCGGKSGEREISLNSGKACAEALASLGFKTTILDTANRDDLVKLITDPFDVAFVTLHGKGGEDGTIQGFLETVGIPYTGSGVLANALAIDKALSKKEYREAGLRVAPSMTVSRDDEVDQDILDEMVGVCGIPCVVKPTKEGSSLGMTIVRDEADLRAAIEKALAADEVAIVEQFIAGRELTVAVIGNDDVRALPPIEIVTTSDEFYNYHAKYTPGGSRHLCPAPLSRDMLENVSEVAVAAHEALGCRGISRTDIIVDDEDTCWVLETNTLPGMTGTSLVPDAARVAGIEFPQLCEMLIKYALDDVKPDDAKSQD